MLGTESSVQLNDDDVENRHVAQETSTNYQQVTTSEFFSSSLKHHSTSANADKRSGEDSVSPKRQRSSLESPWTRELRRRTFENSAHSAKRREEFVKAGFWCCKDPQKSTLCLYCLLLCCDGDEENVHPAQFHKALSPTCPFVKSELEDVDVPLNDRRYNQVQPVHGEYLHQPERLQTFRGSPDGEKYAAAGLFFDNGTNVTCFYCGGSMPYGGDDGDPLLEHARCFPDCDFAKNQCGPELHGLIERLARSRI